MMIKCYFMENNCKFIKSTLNEILYIANTVDLYII